MNEVGPSIFINFRDSDQPWAAELLDRALAARYGDDAVFLARRSIRLGVPFDTALLDGVRVSTVLLAVIGQCWLSATDEYGRRRIDRVGGWIRKEILEAHRHGVPVIPVLVGDTARLVPAALPKALRWLAGWHARLRPGHSRQDINQLCVDIENLSLAS